MRLVFLGHSSGLLGAERSMADIAAGAVADGHDVTVVLPAAGPLVGVLQSKGAHVVFVPLRSWLGAWHWVPPVGLARLLQSRGTEPALRDLVRRQAADVVVTNTSVLPAGAAVARAVGVPHVWIVRESLRDNPQLRSLVPKRAIARRILEGADVLCTVSPYVQDQLYNLAGRTHSKAVQVSPNPVTGVRATPPPTGTEPVTLLLPGFFSREKGQHRVVLGAFLARRRGADLQVRLVGRGRQAYVRSLLALRWLLRLHEVVHVIPWADDLHHEFARAHFVVSASRNEAFGRTVVEAFAHGRPVIGLDRGATSLLLAEGGGMLVSPATVRELSRVMSHAAGLSPYELEELSRQAAGRGEEHRRRPSQYEAFRTALASVRLPRTEG